MDPITRTFKLEKATKNTQRYQEDPPQGQPPVVGSLYVQQWALGNPPPPSLTVTIETAKA